MTANLDNLCEFSYSQPLADHIPQNCKGQVSLYQLEVIGQVNMCQKVDNLDNQGDKA